MADLVGQRCNRHVDALGLEARALAVERSVHAELVEQDRRQQRWADEAARRGVERRRRLADLTAIAAGELLSHRLDQLEAARDFLQRLGHVFTQFRQPRSAATGAGRGRINDDPLALDILRPGLAHRSLAREGARVPAFRRRDGCGKLVLARRGHEFVELKFHLLDQPRRAFGTLAIFLALQLLDHQLQMRDQRLGVRQFRLRAGRHCLGLQPRLTLGPQRRQGTCEV